MGDKKFGVKETKELLGFGLGIGNAVGVALADGKLEIAEASLALPVLLKAPEAFDGISGIKNELLDLDAEEKAELHAYVVAEFNIPQENVEAAVETGLKVALELYALVLMFQTKES